MAALTEHDPGYVALSRHLYWAQEPGSRYSIGARQIREQLMEFAWRVRTDEQLTFPIGEPYLKARLGWRRRTKLWVWRATRFGFRRYDRLVADATDLTIALTERVVELEGEVDQLRERLAILEGRVHDR
jgi:hypothetical protein